MVPAVIGLLGLLLFEAVATSAPSPGLAAATCPGNYAQISPVVFDCSADGKSQDSKYLAPAGKTETVFTIPAGVTNFEISMSPETAGSKLDIVVLGANSKKIVESRVGTINDSKTSGQDGALQITYSGSKAEPETVTLTGTTTAPLTVQVKSTDVYPDVVTFTYKYSQVQDCSSAKLLSCKKIQPLAVRQDVVDWSLWVRNKYDGNIKAAWSDLAGPMLEAGTKGGVVPDFKWGYVWDAWPLSKSQGTSWQEVFTYIGKSKRFVTELDFARAFESSRVQAAAKQCMNGLLEKFKTQSAAWQAVQLAAGQSQMLQNCSRETGASESSLRDLMFNLDGQAPLSKEEFQVQWDQLNSCPKGFYRSSPIVFHCHQTIGRAKFYVRSRRTEVLANIPQGMVNMRIGIVADQDVDLLLRDPASKTWVAKWDSGIVNQKQLTGTYKGVNLLFSGDRGKSDASPFVEEFVQMTGTTAESLRAEVNNFATDDATVMVSYSWTGINGACPEVPAGCSAFDELRASDAVSRFSSWMAKTFGSEETAWKKLCAPLADKGSERTKHIMQGVPFHAWEGVWQQWPLHGSDGVSWQEAFHLADTNEDNVVSQSEFAKVYQSHAARDLLKKFLSQVAEQSDAETSWKALRPVSGRVSSQQWTQVVKSFAQDGSLPGGSQSCKPAKPIPDYTYRREVPMRILPGRTSASQFAHLERAESLGLVGGSFTALARVWIGPEAHADEQAIFSTSPHTREDGEMSRLALFIGLAGRRMTLCFSASCNDACTSDEDVPRSSWQEMGWVYDQDANEQRLLMNGHVIKTCSADEPFNGFGQHVVAGRTDQSIGRWDGRLGSLFLFPASLSGKDITEVFKVSPVLRRDKTDSFSGHSSSPVYIAPADVLGLSGGSFTLMLRIRRSQGQSNSEEQGYTIFSTHEAGSARDLGTRLHVRGGKLSVALGSSSVCEASAGLPRGSWVRVAVTFDAEHGETRILQDGKTVKVCRETSPSARGDSSNLAEVFLGRGGSESQGWQGEIEDLMVLDRAECSLNIEATFSGVDAVDGSVQLSGSLLDSAAAGTYQSLDADGSAGIDKQEYLAGIRWASVPGASLYPKEVSSAPSPAASQMVQPAQPAQPAQPSQPAQPAQPAQPSQPAPPAQPSPPVAPPSPPVPSAIAITTPGPLTMTVTRTTMPLPPGMKAAPTSSPPAPAPPVAPGAVVPPTPPKPPAPQAGTAAVSPSVNVPPPPPPPPPAPNSASPASADSVMLGTAANPYIATSAAPLQTTQPSLQATALALATTGAPLQSTPASLQTTAITSAAAPATIAPTTEAATIAPVSSTEPPTTSTLPQGSSQTSVPSGTQTSTPKPKTKIVKIGGLEIEEQESTDHANTDESDLTNWDPFSTFSDDDEKDSSGTDGSSEKGVAPSAGSASTSEIPMDAFTIPPNSLNLAPLKSSTSAAAPVATTAAPPATTAAAAAAPLAVPLAPATVTLPGDSPGLTLPIIMPFPITTTAGAATTVAASVSVTTAAAATAPVIAAAAPAADSGGLSSMFNPSGMYEEHRQVLVTSSEAPEVRWRLPALLALAASGTAMVSLLALAGLRRGLTQRDRSVRSRIRHNESLLPVTEDLETVHLMDDGANSPNPL